MALDIVYYGNETLKTVADEVKNIDGVVVNLVDSMFDSMYRARGIGLAAPQVDIARRIVIIDTQERGVPPLALINPVIKESSRDTEPYEEGCLSVPGIMRDVIRPTMIHVAAVSLDGEEFEFEAGGLTARVIQHEVDHLNGILFVDRLDSFIRNELRAELKRIKKLNRPK
jgi:peptide deformylase